MIEVQQNRMALQELLQLQELKVQINNIKESLRKIDQEKELYENRYSKALEVRKEMQRKIEELKLEVKNIDFKILELEDRIQKIHKRERIIKRPEEFKALLRERAKTEEMILELKNQRAKLNQDINNFYQNHEIKAVESEINEFCFELREIEDGKKRLIQRLEIKTREWQDLCSRVSKELLEEFDRYEKQIGVPFLLKLGDCFDCGRCGTVLSYSQQMSVIKGSLTRCQICGVYLYYDKSSI
ncbi:MAG: hypothetical protein ABDH18_01645 [Aquificaceae bacterium]